jgi:photosystem II stability/assembly factor-like uncharacterized protein
MCVLLVAPAALPIGSRAAGARFEPWAADLVSPSTGFVLGAEGCRFFVSGPQHPCRAVLAGTRDGGARWSMVATPTVLQPLLVSSMSGPTVREVMFADPRDGWLYDPGLWATHDGGRHWSRIALEVSDVVATAGWVYATIASGTGPVLVRSPVNRNDWRAVAGAPRLAAGLGSGGEEPAVPAGLAASGRTIWLGLQTVAGSHSMMELWRSTDGSSWRRISAPCPPGPGLLGLTPSSPTTLLIECDGEELLLSTDGGAHARAIPGVRPSTSIDAAPLGQSATILLATPNTGPSPVNDSPPSELARTSNDGHSWTRTNYPERGIGFYDLQFTNNADGWVIHGYPGATTDELLHTTNAGATFTRIGF